jgi:hypothetical protein
MMDDRILYEKLDEMTDTLARLDERSERAEEDRKDMKGEIASLKATVEAIVVDRKISRIKLMSLLGISAIGGGGATTGLGAVLKAWLGMGGGGQ